MTLNAASFVEHEKTESEGISSLISDLSSLKLWESLNRVMRSEYGGILGSQNLSNCRSNEGFQRYLPENNG